MNAHDQLIEAAEHALAVFQSLAYRGHYPQELLPVDSKGKESPLFMGKQGLDFLMQAIAKAEKDRPRAWVAEMKTSGGNHYYVCVGNAENFLTTRQYAPNLKHQAEYEAAEWNHLFGNGPEPDILDYTQW